MNGLILHNVLLFLLVLLNHLDGLEYSQLTHICLFSLMLHHLYVDGTLSFISTSASSRYFVINTITPYSLLICTSSINVLIKNKPNPPSLKSATGFISSLRLTGPIRSFTSCKSNPVPWSDTITSKRSS